MSQYPLLRIGEEEFVYESCTGLSAKKGSLDGDFTFVPGRCVVYLWFLCILVYARFLVDKCMHSAFLSLLLVTVFQT